jgi:hypothetical protein
VCSLEGILLLLLAVPESESSPDQSHEKKLNTGEGESREKGKVRTPELDIVAILGTVVNMVEKKLKPYILHP